MKIHSRQKRQAARDSLCFRESGEGCQFNSRAITLTSPRGLFSFARRSVVPRRSMAGTNTKDGVVRTDEIDEQNTTR